MTDVNVNKSTRTRHSRKCVSAEPSTVPQPERSQRGCVRGERTQQFVCDKCHSVGPSRVEGILLPRGALRMSDIYDGCEMCVIESRRRPRGKCRPII